MSYGGAPEAERLSRVAEPASLAARLWAKVDVRGPDECWPWLGAMTNSGYGHMADGTGHFTGPHRAAYLVTHGSIDPALTIDHLCRNRVCCNPAHLEQVSRGENGLRGDTFQARNKAKTHCPQGHEYTAANTKISRRNQRSCRACERDRARVARTNKRHVHEFDTMPPTLVAVANPSLSLMELLVCTCGLTRSEYESRQRRGRLARSRGIKIQRQRNQGLGMRNLSGNNPNLDGMSELFASESKSGGAFSERYWRWLKGVKLITSQQVPILIVTDTPGPGRKSRALVVLDYDDWRELHGEG